ncbi:MAG: very short patch repair endonuclease [Planctomycetaceae bacterium]|nr:very short patch repair endonuclease [Planctomycetaceae bacterium]
MSDTFTRAERSRIMAAVKSTNTTPELVLRRLLFSMGYRYRLHVKSLPGSPDIVFPGRKKVIIVNGCFWHMHSCKNFRMPNTSKTYWRAKFLSNKARDERTRRLLRRKGWRPLVVWECQLASRRLPATLKRVSAFLRPS